MSFCIFVNELEDRKHCPGFRLGDFMMFEVMNSFLFIFIFSKGKLEGRFFKNVFLKPWSTHEKDICQIPLEGRSAKDLASPPQDGQGHRNKESPRNGPSWEDPKETGQLYVTWYRG